MACAPGTSGQEPEKVPPVSTELPPSALLAARHLRGADSLLLVHAAQDARDIAAAAVPRDATGLIGRNREWGDMYASRFQMGTGQALRVALAVPPGEERVADARSAFLGIAAGVRGIESSGRLPARLPVSVSLGMEPKPVDVTSGAAFYLGDACLGLLALEASPSAAAVASSQERTALRGQLVHAARWLVTQGPMLLAGDAHAPNRLLFDARAYLACGIVAGDSAIQGSALQFITAWQSTVSPAGWFDEGGGWDTSYQAVSLDIGIDVLLLLSPGATHDTLQLALRQGANWLQGRVLPDGRVESSGNRRTCDGGESFLGTPKTLALTSVVMGLSRVAVHGDRAVDTSLLGAAQRVSGWARRNPGVNPCYSGAS